MPFNRVWDPDKGGYERSDTITGPPPPPETGTVVKEDGTVVVANQNVTPTIPPATPVQVNFPGPNEPIVGPDGRITPRWWRFLDELYRRTGGPVDNINKAPATYLSAGAAASLVLSGSTPTVSVTTDIFEFPSAGSLAFSSDAPTVTVA